MYRKRDRHRPRMLLLILYMVLRSEPVPCIPIYIHNAGEPVWRKPLTLFLLFFVALLVLFWELRLIDAFDFVPRIGERQLPLELDGIRRLAGP
jgi:hypothetical protein